MVEPIVGPDTVCVAKGLCDNRFGPANGRPGLMPPLLPGHKTAQFLLGAVLRETVFVPMGPAGESVPERPPRSGSDPSSRLPAHRVGHRQHHARKCYS